MLRRPSFSPGKTKSTRVPRFLTFGLPTFCISVVGWTGLADAAPPPLLVPGIEAFRQSPEEGGATTGPFGFLNGITRSQYLLGDMWGLRTLLGKYGISLALTETTEVFGNVTGGVRQGFEYDGLTQMALQSDTQ